jgi:hypothetical protein
MSVETYTHQVPEALTLPDDVEVTMRTILAEHAHLQSFDLENALHNPADALSRMANMLLQRYTSLKDGEIVYSEKASQLLNTIDVSSTFTVGSGFTDALQIKTWQHEKDGNLASPHCTEIAMFTDGMNTMYPEGTVALIRIEEDLAWVSIVGFAGRTKLGMARYIESDALQPYVVHEAYSHAFTRLMQAVLETDTLPHLREYTVRELGKYATAERLAA